MRYFISGAMLFFMAACLSDHERGPRTKEERAMAKECTAKGGKFARTGIYAQITFCQMPKRAAVDAGQMCTDGSQCEAGSCLAETGTCAPVVNAWICEPVLEKGERLEVLCPD